MAKDRRSARTGRFVTKRQAAADPETTLGERRGGRPAGSARSAITGKFVTAATAKRWPSKAGTAR